MTPSPRRRRALLVACGALAGLLAGEACVRALMPQPTLSGIRESPAYYRRSDRYPLALAPGTAWPQEAPEYRSRITINPMGLRDRVRPLTKPPGTYRILCLGDSFTFGHGVGDAEAWPCRLDALCPPGAEAWNLGYVAGFSPDSYALFARTDMAGFNPDLLIVQVFVWNDIDDIRNNLWEDPAEDGFPRRIRSTCNYIDHEGRRLFTALYPLRLRIPFLRESHLFQLAARILTGTDGLRPPARWDYTRRVHQGELPAELAEPWARFVRSLGALREACEARGVRLLVVLVPDLLQLRDCPTYRAIYMADPAGPFDPEEPNRRMRRALDGQGIPCLDLLGPFRRERPEDLYYPWDGHLKPAGQELLSRMVAAELTSKGWLPAK